MKRYQNLILEEFIYQIILNGIQLKIKLMIKKYNFKEAKKILAELIEKCQI